MASNKYTHRKLGGNPLHIIVRFTLSIPDLVVDIATPSTTSVVYLKHVIRSKLSSPTSSNRLRLIHGGKILTDAALLPTVLKIPQPPPRDAQDAAGKGKAADVYQARVYINCSIGDPLTPEELEAEANAALSSSALADGPGPEAADTSASTDPKVSTTPAPRGFDRLLATGFTAAEVGQLRLQFLSIRASQYTPDTMPSPTSLRRMEDEWIDDDGATAMGGNEATAAAASMATDDLLIGLVVGFICPLATLVWVGREQGDWSRRQTAVYSGSILSLIFGVMSYLG